MSVFRPDASPEDVVQALQARALSFLINADVVLDRDRGAAAQAREEATQLRCRAAVIEAMSATVNHHLKPDNSTHSWRT